MIPGGCYLNSLPASFRNVHVAGVMPSVMFYIVQLLSAQGYERISLCRVLAIPSRVWELTSVSNVNIILNLTCVVLAR